MLDQAQGRDQDLTTHLITLIKVSFLFVKIIAKDDSKERKIPKFLTPKQNILGKGNKSLIFQRKVTGRVGSFNSLDSTVLPPIIKDELK